MRFFRYSHDSEAIRQLWDAVQGQEFDSLEKKAQIKGAPLGRRKIRNAPHRALFYEVVFRFE